MIRSSRLPAASGPRHLPPNRMPVCNFSKCGPMQTAANLRRASLAALTLILILLVSCGQSSPRASSQPNAPSSRLESPATNSELEDAPTSLSDSPDQPSSGKVILLRNQGGSMEGHTPRGFRGMGTGLFAGDNLNPRFPNGDGVQMFLTFDLSALPSGKVVSAKLRSENASVQGMPLKDLGPWRAEEVRYSEFSPALWNLRVPAGGDSCVFATSSKGPFQCSLTDAVQRSLDDSYPLVQFRLLLDRAGDNDRKQDLVAFFIADSNTNQPGIFVLEVKVDPGS